MKFAIQIKKQKAFRAVIAATLSMIVPASVLGQEAGSEYRVVYDGGTAPDLKPGANLKLLVSGDQIHFLNGRKQVLTIPASSVTEISYGQDVHRRVGALMALTKSQEALRRADLGRRRGQGRHGDPVRQE